MSEWISVKDRKPSPQDSPILAFNTFAHFSTKALQYMDGWDGLGWYDDSEEFGMALNEEEAHYNEYNVMLYWQPLPKPPEDKPEHENNKIIIKRCPYCHYPKWPPQTMMVTCQCRNSI
jgi:hypothetical protein